MAPIFGFEDPKICRSKIRVGETKIIFAVLSNDRQKIIVAETPLRKKSNTLNLKFLKNLNCKKKYSKVFNFV